MAPAENVNRLGNGISEAEFQKLLNQSVFDEKQKDNVLSIFTKLSQGDGELSVEDWNNFIAQTDKGKKDGNLSIQEISDAVKRKAHSLYKQTKNAVIDFYNMVKNYIEQKINFSKTRQNGSIEVVHSQYNPHRAKSSTSGTFEGGWIECDKYGSTTYDEWMKNNKYEFDEETANTFQINAESYNGNRKGKKKTFVSKGKTLTYEGYCAAAFKNYASDTTAVNSARFAKLHDEQAEGDFDEESEDNILNGELKSTKLFNRMEVQGSAYQYASELAKNPYFKEVPHNIVATMDLKSLPRGCVIIYDGGYKTSKNKDGSTNYHTSGHIAVANGDGTDSGGGRYNMVINKQATHIRVFIPIKISDEES